MTLDSDSSKPVETVACPAVVSTTSPRSFRIDALHIFSLSSFVVAQSIYDQLGHQSGYLVDPRARPAAIAGVVVVLSLVLPGLIVGLESLAGWRSRRFRESLHLGVVQIFASLMGLQILRRIEVFPGWVEVLLGLGMGCGFAVCYARFANIRLLVTMALIGVLAFPGWLAWELKGADSTIAHRAMRVEGADPAPVVFVVFDEFCGGALMTPNREIDASRFPHFAALRHEATWYRKAASVSPTTVRALPSILTGNLLTTQFASEASRLPQNLFSLLASAGEYEIVAFEPISALAPSRSSDARVGFQSLLLDTRAMLNVLGLVYLYEITPDDFHHHLPVIPSVWFGMHDSNRVVRSAKRGSFRYGWTDKRDEQVEHFLECIDQTPQSVLYFAHFLIPHAPWCYFPTGTRYAEDRDSQDRLCLEDSSLKMSDELGEIQNQQRHLLQVMYVDQQLGRLVERLKEQGIWDRCLLIVTADHGVSFRPGQDRREYTGGNTEDILSIPLFIKLPQQTQGEISDLPVQSIDLLPTVMDVVGIQPVIPMMGRSVRDPQVASRNSVVVHDAQYNLSFPISTLDHAPVSALIEKRFGSGTDRWNLFRIGPHAEWLGQPISSLSVVPSPLVELECFEPSEMNAPVGLKLKPYHIRGRIIAPVEPKEPIELVVVVDSIICGTARTYRQFGFTDRWEVMLPEWSYPVISPSLTGPVTPKFFVVNPSDESVSPCRVKWGETPEPQLP